LAITILVAGKSKERSRIPSGGVTSAAPQKLYAAPLPESPLRRQRRDGWRPGGREALEVRSNHVAQCGDWAVGCVADWANNTISELACVPAWTMPTIPSTSPN